MAWFVYILRCGDDSLYTGITNNIEKRINAHENGSGAKYTKGRGPLTLVYMQECADKSTAAKREMEIKKMGREKKEALVSKRGVSE